MIKLVKDQVILDDPFIVTFLSNNSDNEELLKACENVLLSFCKTSMEYMNVYTKEIESKSRDDIILNYIKEYKGQQDKLCMELVNSMNETLSTKLGDMNNKLLDKVNDTNDKLTFKLGIVSNMVSEKTNDTNEKLSSKLDIINKSLVERLNGFDKLICNSLSNNIGNVVTTISQIITLAMEKFNPDTLTQSLGNTLSTNVDKLHKSCQKDNELNLYRLKSDIEQQITQNIEPLLHCQNKVLESMKEIKANLCETIDEDERNAILNVKDTIDLICCNIDELTEKLSRDLVRMERDVMKSVAEKIAEVDKKNKGRYSSIVQYVESLPVLTKCAINDSIQSITSKAVETKVRITETKESIDKLCKQVSDNNESLGKLQHFTTDMNNRLDSIEKELHRRATSNKHKGDVGEKQIYDLLGSRLYMKDGYTIEQVSGISHSCDILVKREGYPPIRIEVKAHTERVQSKEVEKFKRDLMELHNHGVFVSLHSDISGIQSHELEQLANGKFAVYLPNNEYDIDQVISMIHLLYKIDELISCDDSQNNIIVSRKVMSQVRDQIIEYNNQINRAKHHMKESLNILTELQLSSIERLILGNHDEIEKDIQSRTCDKCSKVFKKRSAMISHKKTCKHVSITTEPV